MQKIGTEALGPRKSQHTASQADRAHLHALDAVDDFDIQAESGQQLEGVSALGLVRGQADEISLGGRLRVAPALLLVAAETLPRLPQPPYSPSSKGCWW